MGLYSQRSVLLLGSLQDVDTHWFDPIAKGFASVTLRFVFATPGVSEAKITLDIQLLNARLWQTRSWTKSCARKRISWKILFRECSK